MIFIEKESKAPDISVYTSKRSQLPDGTRVTKAEKETLMAINFYGDPTKFSNNRKVTPDSDPEFKVYSNKKLKKKLIEVFNGKCAYCESYVIGTAPGDIEHFRPKKKVVLPDGKELIPGYYWLAADWKNLLLSCGNCNRTTTQRINDGTEDVTMGKLSQFPLSDESKRVRFHNDDIKNEEKYRLLINPCDESPDEHFTFTDSGEVRASEVNGEISMKGDTSIQVYGLYRATLNVQRQKCIENLKYVLLKIYDSVQDLKFFENNELAIERTYKRLEDDMDRLIELFSNEAVYLAMKKQKLKRFIQEDPVIYNTLLQVEIDLKDLL